MLQVLTLGWPWFAAAAALGSVVGFATATRDSDKEFSGRWVIALAFICLGALAVAASAASGAVGVLLEVAFLAGFAYFVGLPVGSALKTGAPAPAREPTRATPVVLRGAERIDAASMPQPTITGSDARPIDVKPIAAPTAARAPATKSAKPAARSKPAPVDATGRPPQTLTAARNGAPDDLGKIKGVGPKSIEKLHSLGVYHYDQIAAWNVDNARWVGAALGSPGRVEKGKWIQQARALAEQGVGRAH